MSSYRTDDALCGIYEIVNQSNGKKYIGQSINILQRWKDHQRTLNSNSSHSKLLQRAWNKYGADSFVMNVLETCDESQLDELEIQYIIMYDTINNGYNIEAGGNVNKRLSDKTKQLIRDAHLGKPLSLEAKYKMSEARKGANNPMYGKTHTKEARQKISQACKGQSRYPMSEQQKDHMRQINLGKVLSEETKRKISEAHKGNVPHNKNFTPVYCVELDRIFACPTEASKELQISSANIICCCKGIRKTCGGFHWQYADSDNDSFVFRSTIDNTKLLSPDKEVR